MTMIENAGMISGWSFICLKQDLTSFVCNPISTTGYDMRKSQMRSRRVSIVSPYRQSISEPLGIDVMRLSGTDDAVKV